MLHGDGRMRTTYSGQEDSEFEFDPFGVACDSKSRIGRVVNKSEAYSFLIIGMMHLQKILLSVIMLRFHFFTAKQGT